MGEQYSGVKFKTVFITELLPDNPNIEKLIHWGRQLHLLGLTKEYNNTAAGNLSFRTNDGFIVTGTAKSLGTLTKDDFVEVRKCNFVDKIIQAAGKAEPSSESMLHSAIYQQRTDVNFIFHVHDKIVTTKYQKLGLKCTDKSQPYGTTALIDEVLKIINENYLVIKDHGIISLGTSADEAGQRVLEINSKL